MKTAYFTHVWGRENLTVRDRYDELWREVEAADRLGFDYAFSVEHHCTPRESWMSSPVAFATGAALRTERIRVGPMGWVPPLRHPLHVVEEVATLDQLLGGRLEVGLASGVSDEPFLPFGADFARRKVLNRECADLLRTAFAAEGPFDFDGPVHRMRDIELSFGAVQRPHPPIWIPTGDRATLRYLATIGGHTASTMIVPRAATATVYRHFVDWWRAGGRTGEPNIGYWSLVHVAETDAEAESRAADQVVDAFVNTLRYGSVKRSGTPAAPASRLSTADILAGCHDFKFLLDQNLVFVGSPETVAERIRAAALEGCFNTLFGEFVFGDIAGAEAIRSMELYAEGVLPRLADFSPFAAQEAEADGPDAPAGDRADGGPREQGRTAVPAAVPGPYSADEQDEVAARLEALGYID
ncbi:MULTISPECIES: LLM class flavin-dependent oxidoreductase [unclassified Streptomyces]|uniref:LLM class flavin-dependent oxidoreductase n=1 Tax=Streptomycetaceae TaxID=2062 RepID=UPI002E7A8B00|nr:MULTISPECIES: LLM class flavin-dependent oxidoreductase [unclassified Streptomyces]MED7953444.1 LLM class flavin-dependent oxidoreductase [Streptomyces sp. BE303]MEE1823090.1 LLM class flavin-dependent oxidoreductase [Streptomyces sp. BE20]